MKWGIEAERTLAILALQQHSNLKVDAQAIVDAWPGNVKPTIRAVKDRLLGLKKMDLASVSSTGTIQSTPDASTGNNTAMSTAIHPALSTSNTPTRTQGGNTNTLRQRSSKAKGSRTKSRKRNKRNDDDDDEETEVDEMSDTTASEEEVNEEVLSIQIPPRRRLVPRSRKAPAKYTVDDDDEDEDDDDDDGDDNGDHRKDAGELDDVMDHDFDLEEYRRVKHGKGKDKAKKA